MSSKENNYRNRRMRRMRSILLGVIITMWPGAVQSASQEPVLKTEAEARLRERMSAYWDAMLKAQYELAVQYIYPDQRPQFMHEIPKSRVLKWKISQVACNKDQTECDTVTLVTKPLPIGGNVDWSIHNRWVLVGGDWYFQIPWGKGQNPLIGVFKEQQSIGIVENSPQGDPLKSTAPAPRTPVPPRHQFVPDNSNPSTVHLGEKISFRYNYTNTGNKPTKIVSVHADCHCTSVKKDYPEIAPGQSGTLEVTLDTFGLSVGHLDKEVVVQFDDMPTPIVLTLSVENQPNFEVVPTQLNFGTVAREGVIERSVRLTNRSGKTVKIVALIKSDPRLEVTSPKSTIGSNESLLLSLRYRTNLAGEFFDNLLIRTDLEAEPMISVQIRGTVQP